MAIEKPTHEGRAQLGDTANPAKFFLRVDSSSLSVLIELFFVDAIGLRP